MVTGSRADFGLLRPVMRAVGSHAELELLGIAAGSHLIAPALPFRDVKADFEVADSIPMQRAGHAPRADGRGGGGLRGAAAGRRRRGGHGLGRPKPHVGELHGVWGSGASAGGQGAGAAGTLMLET